LLPLPCAPTLQLRDAHNAQGARGPEGAGGGGGGTFFEALLSTQGALHGLSAGVALRRLVLRHLR